MLDEFWGIPEPVVLQGVPKLDGTENPVLSSEGGFRLPRLKARGDSRVCQLLAERQNERPNDGIDGTRYR